MNYNSVREDVERANRVLIIGGGTRAIEIAAKLVTAFHPPKHVTIVHDEPTLLSHTSPEVEHEVRSWLHRHGVIVELCEEVVMARKTLAHPSNTEPLFLLRFSGRPVFAEKVFNCVDVPSTAFLQHFITQVLTADGRVSVLFSCISLPCTKLTRLAEQVNNNLQVCSSTDGHVLDRIYCIGDFVKLPPPWRTFPSVCYSLLRFLQIRCLFEFSRRRSERNLAIDPPSTVRRRPYHKRFVSTSALLSPTTTRISQILQGHLSRSLSNMKSFAEFLIVFSHMSWKRGGPFDSTLRAASQCNTEGSSRFFVPYRALLNILLLSVVGRGDMAMEMRNQYYDYLMKLVLDRTKSKDKEKERDKGKLEKEKGRDISRPKTREKSLNLQMTSMKVQ